MWTSNIINKRKDNEKFFIDVLYTNGMEKFIENIDMTGGSVNVVNIKIADRLNTLNASDTLETQVTLGNFIPTKPVTLENAFLEALKHFQACKRAVNLGLITDKDKIFVDAFDAVLASYDPTFIDFI